MADLSGKTLFITGASRGIGLAIALKAAKDGANVTVAAKTDQPHPKLEGTIHTAAEQIEAAGGKALAVVCDVRDEASVQAAVDQTVETFGGLDICINNASAIMLTGTLQTPMKRYDLMHQVNGRGTYLVSRTCIPHLKKAANPHIMAISPPLDFSPKWFKNHPAYSMAKYTMSVYMMAMAAEFEKDGIACNTLWPRTAIATAAVQNLLGGDELTKMSRTPEIMADAAYEILTKPSREFTGQHCMDDIVLYEAGNRDWDQYAVTPGGPLAPDFFCPDDMPPPPGSHDVPVGAKLSGE
ncbi:NAD(P)-dependent oxidoreductase [bacterium]|nr:NAD(P)-dependent oxidoreductase [bacterium]